MGEQDPCHSPKKTGRALRASSRLSTIMPWAIACCMALF
jgi:hypothetical protein